MRFKDLAHLLSIWRPATREEFSEICAFKSEILGIHKEPTFKTGTTKWMGLFRWDKDTYR
jgi:hypothetical protein